ncbi:hypothetical protein Busp01_32210 [Trinickia caryophylli]|nr:hypothetical protein C0Z17_02685 [Trinickia caryophylli]GLU33379.1 hypothetical protein Busp01_32210 [Trinickia caryophylli]
MLLRKTSGSRRAIVPISSYGIRHGRSFLARVHARVRLMPNPVKRLIRCAANATRAAAHAEDAGTRIGET